jgi:gliding motility-associated-like protein
VFINGEIYVAGSFSGAVNMSLTGSPVVLNSKGKKDIFVAKYDAARALIWAISIGGSEDDIAQDIALDKLGNVAVVGQFHGQNIDFNPGTGINYLHAKGPTSSITSQCDGFIAKYSAKGNYVWAHALGGTTEHDDAQSVAIDIYDNIYVGGNFHKDMDIDADPFNTTLLNSNNGTGYMVKYTGAGKLLFGFTLGGGGISGVDNTVWVMKVDGESNICIAGCFQGANNDFDPSPAIATLPLLGSYDGYIAKYTSEGKYVFAKAISGAGNDQVLDLSIDEKSSIYISGLTESSELKVEGNTYKTQAIFGKADVFISKYTKGGTHVWTNIFGGNGNDVGWGITTVNKQVYAVGYFQGAVDFDPTSASEIQTAKGRNDMYMSKYDDAGNYICTFTVGDTLNDIVRKASFDASGNLYICGYFSAPYVDFDPGSGELPLSYTTQNNGFFASYDWAYTQPIPDGYLTAANPICKTEQPKLKFHATSGIGPFIITYADGTNYYTLKDIYDGQEFYAPFNIQQDTKFTLISIEGNGNCPPIGMPNAELNVKVYPKPQANAGIDTNVCPGATITLKGIANPPGNFKWFPETNLEFSNTLTPKAYISASITYSLIVTNGYGCSDTDDVNINVIPPGFKLDPEIDVCLGDKITIKAEGGHIYSWFQHPTLLGDDSPTPIISPTENTVYTVTINDTVCNRSATLSILAKILPLPDVSIPGVKDIDCGAKEGELYATGAVSYQWTPVDGLSDPLSPNPKAITWQTITYIVKGTGANGCSDTASAEVKVFDGMGRLFAPTAFTPNNDGLNDGYCIKIPGIITKYKFSIFNRWGQLMFSTTDPLARWDGRYLGTEQPIGTYFYQYEGHSSSCGHVRGKGDFQLIR